MSDRLIVPGGMSRRHFLGHMATTALTVPAMQFAASLEANAQQLRKQNKSMILLWMSGGPASIDIWDLKPDSEKNGGEFKPIATSAPGVMIGEHMPLVAKQMKHLKRHPVAEFQGRESRSRPVHDAHRLRPQPDRRPPGVRLGPLV